MSDLKPMKIQPTDKMYKILEYLDLSGDSSPADIYSQFGGDTGVLTLAQFTACNLELLAIAGYAEFNQADFLWSITPAGREVIEGPKPEEAVRATVRKSVIPWSSEIYKGAELGKTCTRIGAYDAYALPSRIGNKLVKRGEYV